MSRVKLFRNQNVQERFTIAKPRVITNSNTNPDHVNLFFPIFPFDPPENIREPLVF